MEYTLNLLSAVSAGELPLPAVCVAVFAVAFILYVYIAKAINAKKAPSAPAAVQAPAAAASTPAATVYAGPVLTGVEENEAAVIMAIVSNKTGIPLNRLAFKSIKLMEDK